MEAFIPIPYSSGTVANTGKRMGILPDKLKCWLRMRRERRERFPRHQPFPPKETAS